MWCWLFSFSQVGSPFYGMLPMPNLLLPHTVDQFALSQKEKLAIDLVYCRTAANGDAQDGHFINIHSDAWVTVLGRNYYKATLASLEQQQILETNDKYAAGRFSKSYRLTEHHRVPRYIAHPLDQHQKTPLRIRLAADDWVGQALADQFGKVLLPDSYRPKGWNQPVIQQIRNHEYYATRCPYGRFHTSFTGLNKAARRLLMTLNRDPLHELDVSHAQPLMIPAMMRRAGYKISTSTQKFITLCESGKLYDHLADACQAAGLLLGDCYQPGTWGSHWKPQTIQRSNAKKSFIVVLFCENDMMLAHPVFRIVEALFPDVAQFMVDAKTAESPQLARDCQRCESGMLIDGACASLLRQFPDAAFLTIHDAILTTAAFLPFVASAIWQQFGELGIRPTLKAGGVVMA